MADSDSRPMSHAVPESAPLLLDERSPSGFRTIFGDLLSQSLAVDTALLRIRLGSVDLAAEEVHLLRRFRVLVAEVNARTVEEEAYALLMDPLNRENLVRIRALLEGGVMEIRSAPLGGWAPDFSVFTNRHGPHSLLLGPHWFRRPFPHRGPAWGARFGPAEAHRGSLRFQELWEGAHDIGGAIEALMDRAAQREERDDHNPVDTPLAPG